MRICHVTSVHRRYDVRIFHKESKTLRQSGYDVTLLVNDDKNDEVISGVKFISLNYQPKNRYQRMVKVTKLLLVRALEIDADIYHLHDPELLTLALKLKRKGKKVIFDSHEDYLLTITEKKWLPKLLRPLIRFLYQKYEKRIIKRIDGAIVCYHWTRDRYLKYNQNVSMIFNFPIIDKNLPYPLTDYTKRAVAFAGGIKSEWCHKEIILALEKLKDVKYELAGDIQDNYDQVITPMKGWKQVNYHDKISHSEVYQNVYANSSIGMALLDYIAQCKGNIGNLSNTKLFEYMYVGLPIIGTDFKLWKEVIETENCGICVNPHDVTKISETIKYLLDNPLVMKQMGENGHRAILEKYNWNTEAKKLLAIYEIVRGEQND